MIPIGIAIVGYGRWGVNLARVLMASPHFHLTAIVDIDESRRQAASEAYPEVDVFAQLEIACMPAALAVATPPRTLPHLAQEIIASGRHAFVEKPCALHAAEALALAYQAQTNGCVLSVDLTPAWSPLQDATAALLATGTIGTLLAWHSQRTNPGHGQPGIDVLRDLAIHDLAIINALLPERPETITIKHAIRGTDGQIISAAMEMSYPTGLVAEISASWVGNIRQRQTTIIGTKGTILRDDISSPNHLLVTNTANRNHNQNEIYPVSIIKEPLVRILDDFAQSIHTGSAPKTNAFTAATLLSWIEMAEPFDSCHIEPSSLTAFI